MAVRMNFELNVLGCWNEALELMNHAVMDHTQPGARENIAYLTLTERRRDFEPDRKDVPEVCTLVMECEDLPVTNGKPCFVIDVLYFLSSLSLV